MARKHGEVIRRGRRVSRQAGLFPGSSSPQIDLRRNTFCRSTVRAEEPFLYIMIGVASRSRVFWRGGISVWVGAIVAAHFAWRFLYSSPTCSFGF